MKKLLLVPLLLLAPVVVNASHIDATSLYSLHTMASVNSFTGEWVNTAGVANDFSHIPDLVFNPVTGNDSVIFNTDVTSQSDFATLTLDFGGDIVGNLAGHDLAIFTLGETTLDITANGITNRYTSSTIQIGGVDQGIFSNDGTFLDYNDVILIDLTDYALSSGFGIDSFLIDSLDAAANPKFFPSITAAGGFNTEGILPPTAVVPLPLPVLLFGSGLGLIGLLARRRS